MQTEQIYMRHLVAHMDGQPRAPLATGLGAEEFGAGTVNHRGLRVVCLYADAPQGLAAERLANFLRAQRKGGHLKIGKACEINSSSHGQLNLAWAAVGLWAALKRGDEKLVEDFHFWWHNEIWLWRACAARVSVKRGPARTTVWAPGARAELKGELKAQNSARDLAFDLVEGRPVPSSDRPLWRDKYNLGPRALLEIGARERLGLLPPEDFEPVLAYDFTVERFDGGNFHAYFPSPPAEKDFAAHAGVKEGEPWIERSEPGFDYREQPTETLSVKGVSQ